MCSGRRPSNAASWRSVRDWREGHKLVWRPEATYFSGPSMLPRYILPCPDNQLCAKLLAADAATCLAHYSRHNAHVLVAVMLKKDVCAVIWLPSFCPDYGLLRWILSCSMPTMHGCGADTKVVLYGCLSKRPCCHRNAVMQSVVC